MSNSLFVYLFVKVVADVIAADIDKSLADLRPGEVKLKLLSNQLKKNQKYLKTINAVTWQMELLNCMG